VAEFEAAEMVGVEELIQAADRNMYKNKAAKR
jgi:PleD family two-component response regulator